MLYTWGFAEILGEEETGSLDSFKWMDLCTAANLLIYIILL